MVARKTNKHRSQTGHATSSQTGHVTSCSFQTSSTVSGTGRASRSVRLYQRTTTWVKLSLVSSGPLGRKIQIRDLTSSTSWANWGRSPAESKKEILFTDFYNVSIFCLIVHVVPIQYVKQCVMCQIPVIMTIHDKHALQPSMYARSIVRRYIKPIFKITCRKI